MGETERDEEDLPAQDFLDLAKLQLNLLAAEGVRHSDDVPLVVVDGMVLD